MHTASFLNFILPVAIVVITVAISLIWYYWHLAHEGQLFGTGLSDKYLSTSLVISQLLFLCLFDMQASQKAPRTALMFLNFDLSEHSGLMHLGGGSLPPSLLSSLSWIALCRSNKAFVLVLSSRERRALSNRSVRFVNF